MADFKIQQKTATIPVDATTVTVTAGVDYDAPSAATAGFPLVRAVGYHGCCDNTSTVDPSYTAGGISNPGNIMTSLTFARGSANATWPVTIYYEIWEYTGPGGGANEFIVRDMALLSYVSNENTVDSGTVSGVADDNDMCVFILGQYGSDTTMSALYNIISTAEWVSASDIVRLTRDRQQAVVANVAYAAVEFTGSNWTVQRVTHTTTTTSAETETISDVGALTRAFVHPQWHSGDGTQNYSFSLRVWLSSTTAVSFQVDSQVTLHPIAVAWVISNSQTDGTPANCLRYSSTYTTTGTANVTVTAVADVAQSSVVEISQTNTQNTNSPGRDQATHKLTTTTNVDIRHLGSLGTTTYRFGLFEWPTAPAAGGAHLLLGSDYRLPAQL